MADNDDLLDYEDEEQTEQVVVETNDVPKKDVKGTYVSIHSSGFRDFLLKPEILRAIADCGFEHPSEGKPSHNTFFVSFFSSYALRRRFRARQRYMLCLINMTTCLCAIHMILFLWQYSTCTIENEIKFFFSIFIYFTLDLVQHECIPQAVLGMDILCQAKSGKFRHLMDFLFNFYRDSPQMEENTDLCLF